MENGYCIEQSSNKLSDEEFEFLSEHSYATYDVFVDFLKTYGHDPEFAFKVLRTITPDGVNEEGLTRVMFKKARTGENPMLTTPHKKLPEKYEKALSAYLRPIVKYLDHYKETEPNNDPLWWNEDGVHTEYFHERFEAKNGQPVSGITIEQQPVRIPYDLGSAIGKRKKQSASRSSKRKDRIRYSNLVTRALVAKNIGDGVPIREIAKVLMSRFPDYKLSTTKIGYLIRSRPEVVKRVANQLGLSKSEYRHIRVIKTGKRHIKKVLSPKSKSEEVDIERLVECIQSIKVKNKGDSMTRDIFGAFPDLRDDLVRLYGKRGDMDCKTFADIFKVHHDTVRRYERMASLRSDQSYLEAREERIKIHKEGEALVDYFNEHGRLPKEAAQPAEGSITKEQVKEMMDQNNSKLLKEISALLSKPQQELEEVNRDNDSHSEDIEDIGHISF